jgi:hypothetical protein
MAFENRLQSGCCSDWGRGQYFQKGERRMILKGQIWKESLKRVLWISFAQDLMFIKIFEAAVLLPEESLPEIELAAEWKLCLTEIRFLKSL